MKTTFNKTVLSSPSIYYYLTVFSIDYHKVKYQDGYMRSITIIICNYRLNFEHLKNYNQ